MMIINPIRSSKANDCTFFFFGSLVAQTTRIDMTDLNCHWARMEFKKRNGKQNVKTKMYKRGEEKSIV